MSQKSVFNLGTNTPAYFRPKKSFMALIPVVNVIKLFSFAADDKAK
jgi:hypothetical protein